jgi:hypothetical protein
MILIIIFNKNWGKLNLSTTNLQIFKKWFYQL